MTAPISQAAVDLIISCEVSSRPYYEKNYQRPEWPGGASGITIAIGYDLGYAGVAKIAADWAGKRNPVSVLQKYDHGVHGEAARALLSSARSEISVPWAEAIDVFMNRDVPEWTDTVCKAVPGASRLHPHCLGALVSIAYNRGASFNAAGDRYREMRAIRDHVSSNQLELVPAEIRSMKRLWPSVKGLRDRRDAEARLFEHGLAEPVPAVPPAPVAKEAPPAALPKPPASVQEHAGANTAGGAGGGLATQFDLSWWQIGLFAAGIVLAIYLIAHVMRAPQTARQKG